MRKRLCGVGPLDRLGPEGYTPTVSAQVYAQAIAQATRIVGTGHSAMFDAVLARLEDRTAVERAAQDAGVPFAGVWLDARPETLLRSVAGRQGDPSDADAAVVRQQAADDVGRVAWYRVDAEATVEAVLAEAGSVIG